MNFVTLFQSTKNRDGIFDTRLNHKHFLEAPLQGRIFFEIFSILVQRRCADAVQFAPRQGWFQHIARIHGPFGLAGTDHRMQFIDEENDLAFLFGEVIQDCFEPFLEFTTEFCAGDQRAHIQRENALVAQALRNFVVDDSLGQALHYGRLANARFAYQHGIVLCPALQYLDSSPDFVIATDDGVELALLCAFGQVDCVFLERLASIFGIRVIDLLAAAEFVYGFLDGAANRAGLFQDLDEWRFVIHRGKQEKLAGNILVITLLRLLVCQIQEFAEVVANMHFSASALDFGQPVQRITQLRAEQIDVNPGFHQQAPDRSALLVQHCHHDMRRFNKLVIEADSERLRLGQRHLKFTCQFVHMHSNTVLAHWSQGEALQ